VSERSLTWAAVAAFVVGLGLVFFVELGIARIVGVPLAFVGIALGVRAIAAPAFLEGDEPRREGRR
jgi:hypothetical protein